MRKGTSGWCNKDQKKTFEQIVVAINTKVENAMLTLFQKETLNKVCWLN